MRLRARHKRGSVIIRTRRGSQPVRRFIELNIHHAGRLHERLHRRILWKIGRLLHELRPNWCRSLRSAQPQVAVIVVTDPHDAQQIRGISRKPPVMRTAGLARRGRCEPAQPHGRIAQAVVDHAFHHVGHHVRDPRIQHSLLIRVVVRDDIALRIPHRAQQNGRQSHPVVGKYCVRACHFQRRRVIGSQCHRRSRFHRRDPRRLRQIRHLVVSDFFRNFYCRVVQRHGQRIAQRHVALIFLFVVAWFVNLVSINEARGRIRHGGRGRNHLRRSVEGRIHRGRIHERLEN